MLKNKQKLCGLCSTKIENITVMYGDYLALDRVNFELNCGQLTTIIGPNGAGKSTLLKAILGEIKYKGKLSFSNNKGELTNTPRIGYVPQHTFIDKNSPISVLDLFKALSNTSPAWLNTDPKTKKTAVELLDLVQAKHLLQRKVGDLSGGELQRVLLALALNPLPELLLLDEPVSGVDSNGLKQFYNILQELKSSYDLTILLVSHDLGLVAQYADSVILLNKKVESRGSSLEVFNNARFIDIFGNFN